MAELSRFRFPVSIVFGAGARLVLGEFARDQEVSRPLLVTDAGLVETEAFRLAAAEMDRVWPGGVTQFAGVHPNPTDRDVEEAATAYAEGACDGVVGVGGGSAIDAAKAIRKIIDHGMSDAISQVSVEQGEDPRKYTLVAAGGAGPVHVASLAKPLNIR